MKESDARAAVQLIPLSDHIVSGCTGLLAHLHFDKEYPQHLYGMCAYASMLEFASDINALVKRDRSIGIPVLLRSMLEAFATLRCCVVDPNHFKVMYASLTDQKLFLMKSIGANQSNPYLTKLAESVNIPEQLASLTEELDAYRAMGAGPLRPYQMFEKAGLIAEYQSLYWQLCMHSHNNVSALEDRHIEKNGAAYELTLWKDVDAADTIRYLDSMCGMLLDASEQLHSLLESGKVEDVRTLRASLTTIRSMYTTPTETAGL